MLLLKANLTILENPEPEIRTESEPKNLIRYPTRNVKIPERVL